MDSFSVSNFFGVVLLDLSYVVGVLNVNFLVYFIKDFVKMVKLSYKFNDERFYFMLVFF